VLKSLLWQATVSYLPLRTTRGPARGSGIQSAAPSRYGRAELARALLTDEANSAVDPVRIRFAQWGAARDCGVAVGLPARPRSAVRIIRLGSRTRRGDVGVQPKKANAEAAAGNCKG
jgi:hypothetical protein